MKRILVTGADGFIGSHLTEMLVQQNYEVSALVFYNSQNSWGWLEDTKVKDKVKVINGDIRDPHHCATITEGIDCIINLAALIAIPDSYVSPSSYISTNVMGTLNLCQSAIKNKVSKFIQVSTSEVYGTALYVPIDEKHPLQPQSPYSASKISSDSIAFSFYSSYGLNLSIARPFNTYGPRQSARAIIPTIISQCLSENKIIKLGDLSPTRDFTYVKDTCSGLIAIMNSSKTVGKTINIGSNNEFSVKEILDHIQKLTGNKLDVSFESERIRPKASEVYRLRCDNTLLKKISDFELKYDFIEGLKDTIQWFQQNDNLSKYKSNIYNI